MKQRSEKHSSALFDAKDYELLRMVNMILERDRTEPSRYAEKLLDPDLHPHGIKELALSHDKRIAYAVIDLLESLEAGLAEDRLLALRNLHDEVLYGTMTNFRHNTGRALVQIMKEILRAHGNFDLQLRLAHDFRVATSGRRRVIRTLLKRYHLLEMPETWNQQAFDDHVHDANTKGRKSPTHLIMDAWIKGLRSIKVIYYNYVRSTSAQELMRAASIMNLQVRIGVEFKTRFHGRYVDIIWHPTDFADHNQLAAFLNEEETTHLMNLGQAASRFNDQYVFALLESYNNVHRVDIGNRFGVTLPAISREEFLSHVGTGQPAVLHLAELVYHHAQPHIAKRHAEATEQLSRYQHNSAKDNSSKTGLADRSELQTLLERICSFSPEEIEDIWLSREFNSDLPDPAIARNTTDVPEILRLSTRDMTEWLTRIRKSSRITLSLPGLNADDVLEILYDCAGKITHLELLSLKYFRSEATKELEAINRLQLAINNGRPIALKRLILSIIRGLPLEEAGGREEAGKREETAGLVEKKTEDHGGYVTAGYIPGAYIPGSPLPERSGSGRNEDGAPDTSRASKFREILRNIPRLQSFYRANKLRTAIGSDSTGRSSRRHGMGFVWIETLPGRARQAIRKEAAERHSIRQRLPLYAEANAQVTTIPLNHAQTGTWLGRLGAKIPLLRYFTSFKRHTWVVYPERAVLRRPGNLLTLGGIQQENTSGLCQRREPEQLTGPDRHYINTTLLNTLKVLVGFTAAMLTFNYTQSWWLLAWFGAPIWFGITGFRNIVQAVLGSGGLRRSPLLRWNNYVSRSRLCDSLLFTGLSVPLLELVTRYWLLQGVFAMNPTDHPWLFFTIMSLINGAYIVSHNIYRGLPTGAVVGNIFRSFFAIPVAILYSQIFALLLALAGTAQADTLVLLFSTIVSKTASDTVAGVIEGLAERGVNMRVRIGDFKAKIGHLFDSFSNLEMLLPEEQSVLRLLAEPRPDSRPEARAEPDSESRTASGGQLECATNCSQEQFFEQERDIIIDSLDLLYFWMYQPRARSALKYLLDTMSVEERNIFCRAQFVLTREKEVSQLFVDGIVGRNFARPLAFYLAQARPYLREIMQLAGIKKKLPGEGEGI